MKSRRYWSVKTSWHINITISISLAHVMPVLLIILAFPVWTSGQENAPSTDKVIAKVFETNITEKDKDMLSGIIIRALLDQFALENRIEPTEEEVDIFIIRTAELERRNRIKFERDRLKLIEELKFNSLNVKARKEKEDHLKNLEFIIKTNREMDERAREMESKWRPMKLRMAIDTVRAWKINKALYHKYGGRLIFQQAGIEPLDAYRDFLKEQEKKGAFRIIDKRYEPAFWRYFVDENMHTFYSKDDGARLMERPWWMIEKLSDE
ncbi:MAG: hypothetical protein HZB62_04030 [Nitrospirae bacterium]|nr:hypothetical protein [Nitrospirota bacterium]